MTLHVELVSPEAAVWQGDVESVLLRTIGGGEIQFLTGHAPFLGALDICSIEMRLPDGTLETCAVRGGFVEVSNDRVKILSDDADRPEHIDPDEARAARERAEEILRRVEHGAEAEQAADEIRWQSARLRAAGHQ
ncbi:MAG: ATP synthase F1 subunit epsilon [Acidimicrobiales bacterium]|nr:ATP synthase F1 subunit epsilon [Acidimicrobiales bacterium]